MTDHRVGELQAHEKARLRAAAVRARALYPGPVGEVVAREILDWEIFGFRFGGGSLVMRLADHLLKTPVPTPPNLPA